MSRFTPYLGVTIALLAAVFVLSLSNKVTIERSSPIGARVASSSLAVVPAITIPDITLPNLEFTEEPTALAPATPAPAPAPQKSAPKVEAPAASPVVSAPAVMPDSAPAPIAISNDIGLDATAAALRAALVNIICYVSMGSGLHSISGSGVVIDSKGVILTNAHIAQYFLLRDRGADCTIRTGSPAADRYDAALLYIPAAWLQENARLLSEAQPSGTGERDFAFLAVTKSATSAPLPPSFASVPLASLPPGKNTPVVIASYGAQFLQSSQVQNALFPTIVFGSVKDVFTFDKNTIDVLALGGSAAAQEGSSGGGVADASGALVGTITTSTVEGATDTRSLDAITASYIRGEYASETGQALDLLLAQDPATAAAAFAPQLPTLEALLTAQLP